MSLEQALADNTKAYIENTAAINALTAILQGQSNITLTAQQETKIDVMPKIEEQEIVQKTEETAKVAPQKTEQQTAIPTLEEINKTLMVLAKLHRESAVAVLTKFNVKIAADIPEEQRAVFLNLVKEKISEQEKA